MPSQEEISKALEIIREMIADAKDKKDEEMVSGLIQVRGVLKWVLGEPETAFGKLIEMATRLKGV